MTELDEKKRIAAVILCSVIMSLSFYRVRIFSHVFGERKAIWRLFNFSETDVKTQLLRIIDALHVGNRPGSYPLDAIMTAQAEWEKRYKNPHLLPGEDKKSLAIVISDFISPQVFDPKRDWSNYVDNFLLISFGTDFDSSVLEKYNFPKTLDKNGFLPFYTKRVGCDSVRINPEILVSTCRDNPAIFDNLCDHIINSLINSPSVILPPQPKELNIKLEIAEKVPVFAQVQSASYFSLLKLANSSIYSPLLRGILPSHTETTTNSQWINISQKFSGKKTPCCAHATNALIASK